MRIGLVLNVLDEEYQISIYRGIRDKALEKGIDLICFQHQNTKFTEDPLLTNYKGDEYFNLDGIILLTSVLIDCNFITTKADVEKIWGKIPVVSVGQEIKGVPSFLIQTDDSMKQLVEHLLLQHNYRKFFYIGGPQNHHDAITRENIFTKTMQVYKSWYPELSYKIKHGMFTEQAAINVMEEYYLENPGTNPDVVVCANDNMAIGVYKFFKMNQNNPDIKECAVTGFDDIPQARFEMPSFTTIRQPLQEIGTAAIDSLIDLINGKEQSSIRFVESKFIIRDSCGCNSVRSVENWQENYIQQLQTRYVRTEHYLNLLTHISMDLNYIETIDGFKYILNNSVEQLGVKDFCVLLGEKQITPVYVRCNDKYYHDFFGNDKTTLSDFYEKFVNQREEKATSLIIKYLYSGSRLLGYVLYEGSHTLLPYLSALTVNIAHALIRIESNEERKKRSEYLEKEVTVRTKELVKANNKRMEVEAEVLKISELERLRFSTDLHDDICQRLAGISMLCKSYANFSESVEKGQMEELAGLISDTLQATRQYAHNSYPVELKSLGLKDSIGNLCHSFGQQQGINCAYEWNLVVSDELDDLIKLNVFRIIQEALHNVGKHSRAKNVVVSLDQDENLITIKVCDDGVGIPKDNGSVKRGLGLNSMEYRANQMGASFNICANPSGGTCVIIELSLKR